ncbi:hypothetical protein [Winogradskyella sp.]|uniref:hypothetical protein n=1 Tax=Winogradskyella sp. TaxID=1883156 RepID=UPI0026126462|nr:hypothetical protein [Winogradskyella sp.]
MKSKLHFGILIILITFFLRYLENSVAPNQQIVVQFSNSEISENETQKAIESIKLKLRSIGVEQTQVGEDQEGNLKITYYSTTDVKEIQGILSDLESFKLAYDFGSRYPNETPTENDSKDYKLNVSEIKKKSNTSDWDFEGVQIVEINQKSDRFNNLKKNTFGKQTNSELISQWVKVAIKAVNRDLSLENHSYKTPEVRAGPWVLVGEYLLS